MNPIDSLRKNDIIREPRSESWSSSNFLSDFSKITHPYLKHNIASLKTGTYMKNTVLLNWAPQRFGILKLAVSYFELSLLQQWERLEKKSHMKVISNNNLEEPLVEQ